MKLAHTSTSTKKSFSKKGKMNKLTPYDLFFFFEQQKSFINLEIVTRLIGVRRWQHCLGFVNYFRVKLFHSKRANTHKKK